MFKDIDLRPTVALEKKELVQRVYDLSEENRRLKDKVEFYKNRPPQIKIIKERVKQEHKPINVVYSDSKDFQDTAFACQLYAVDPHTIFKNSRKVEKVQARAVICWILRMRGYSLPRIGKYIGRDHSTVINALKKYNHFVDERRRAAVDDYLKTMYNINEN